MTRKVITLLSDFGLKDPYVAEMKAVILSKCPEVKIVDISHTVDKFDVRMGAFILAAAAAYFPAGTVHVAVVDPGVGTQRRPIIAETAHSRFVGPDNGILVPAALSEGVSHVYAIENRRYILPKVAVTFHGRDVFASAAAYLAHGVEPSRFGKEVEDYMVPKFADAVLEKNTILGEVIHVDDFGNLITNVSPDIVRKLDSENMSMKVEVGKRSATLKFCSAYGAVGKGKPLAIVGGHDLLEISVNQGSAAKHFGARRGDLVRIRGRS
jgi:S-adenosylmethionine hydrolase